MLFELSLSYPALVTVFGRRLSMLEQVCWGLPPADAAPGVPMVEKVVLRGDPEFTGFVEPHDILLADGGTVTVDGLRLRLMQHVEIHTASLGDDLVHNGPVPGDASLDLSIRMVVDDGNAQLCVEYERLNLPPGIPATVALGADEWARAALPTTCVPIPVADLLEDLVARLPFEGAVFTSTDVLNAGLAMAPGAPVSLAIRIEIDAVDGDAGQAWADFHRGVGVAHVVALAEQAGTAPDATAWAFTVDQRLFGQILKSMVPAIEADFYRTQTGHLVLSSPTAEWHPSGDVVGFDLYNGIVPIPTVVAVGLPNLTASLSGVAHNVCAGAFRADIGFDADLTLAFEVPGQDTLRLYTVVDIDLDDVDEVVCVFNVSTAFSPPLAAVLGPIGVAIGTFIAIVIVSMAGDSIGQMPMDPTCREEHHVTVCDMPWNSATPIGQLHLEAGAGSERGLILVGSLSTPVPGYVPRLAPRVDWPFGWEYQGCDPKADVRNLRSIDARVFTGARVCDARVLDHTDTYAVQFTPGGGGVQVRYLRPASDITTDPCRVLIATSDGLALVVVPPPPQLTSEELDKVRERQSIRCRADYRQKKDFRRPPREYEVVRLDRDLVVLHARVAGLARGQRVDLRTGGRGIGSGLSGPSGLASVTAALTAEADIVELSVAPTGRRLGNGGRAAAVDGGVRASREIWRHAGRVAVVGELRDLAGTGTGMWWLATGHGLLRFELRDGRPVLTRHIPRIGLRRLAATGFGLVAGGDFGLDILDPETGAVRAHHDTGPVRMLAGRGATLLTGGGDAVRAYRLRWVPDGRGRLRTPAAEPVNSHEAGGVRSGVLVGRLLVVELPDRLAAYELRPEGTLAPAGALALPGLRGVHGTIGADSGQAVVALVGADAVLVDTDSLAEPRRSLVDLRRRPDTLVLPEIPWFLGARTTGTVLVRPDRVEPEVDVFTLLDRVDLIRREQLLADRLAVTETPA